MSKRVTHTSSIVAIASACGRDKKFNCEGSLGRPMKPLKARHSLQTKGCITLSATNLQTPRHT